MSRSSGRAERRHQRERLKKARRFYWGLDSLNPEGGIELKHSRRVIDTPRPCSCHMCCNPRRSHYSKGERLTIQERKDCERVQYDLLFV